VEPESLRLGDHRLVDIYVTGEQSKSYGSGYAVSDDLVLTAAHVIPDAPSYLVRTLRYEQFRAERVWRGHPEELDAALLRVKGAPWRDTPDRDSLRWGRVAGNGVPCWARGFPKAMEDAARRRDAETMRGSINLTTGSRRGRYYVDVIVPGLAGAPDGRSWWGGISGAALFGPGRELLGVIIADVSAKYRSRLEAVRATSLVKNEEFSRLMSVRSEDLEEVRSRGEVAELDDPGFLLPAYTHLPEGASDAQRLLAGYGVVPFLGRAAEIRSLRDWCTRPDRFGVAVMTGDQGAGKTRLAAELCKELGGAGWSAGFMDLKAVDTFLEKSGSFELVWPMLLVIDESRSLNDRVMALIDQMCRRRRGARLRLLLLDRAPDEAGAGSPLPDQVSWWETLNRRTEGMVARSTQATIKLGAGLLTVPEQRRHMAEALSAFGDGASLARPPDLTDPSPLRLHLAVLNAARGADRQAGDSPEKLLLNSEADRWERLAKARELYLSAEVAHQALALVTMTAPEPAEAVNLLTAIPALGDASGERRSRISEWLAASYPGGRRLGMPSHSLVVDELLEGTRGLAEIVVAIHDHPARTTGHLVSLLDTLRLAAGRRAMAREALHGLLSERLAALVDAAAAEPDSQLPGMADAAIETVSASPADGSLGAAAAALRHPQPSGQLGISQLRCRILDLAVRWQARQLVSTRALADAQTDLTAYRAALGDLAGARGAADAALNSYRRLPGVLEASLARASGNLGICLALKGELEGARQLLEDAATRSARLADLDLAHQPAYVDALIGLSACQADQGGRDLAIKTLLRALAASGRTSGMLGGFIELLGELAGSLTGTPDRAGATTPDPRCYRPPAGMAALPAQSGQAQLSTLLRLAARLTVGLAGRVPTVRRDGLFPAIFPALAREQARRAAWDYAEYLRALTQLLAGQDEFEYAIAAATESVALFRWAAPKEKELRHRLKLPGGLRQLAGCCYLAGRLDQAITHGDEAVAEYRLIRAREAGFPVRVVAETLAERARFLQDADRLPEAIEDRREALALYRDLAAQDDAYLPLLGNSQIQLGQVLSQAGEVDEAAALAQEGAGLLERLSATDPELTEQLVLAHVLLAELAGSRDDSPRSVDSAIRAAELARDDAAADPGKWIDDAQALCMLSSSLEGSGRTGEAFEQAAKAVSLVRQRGAALDDDARTILGWGLSMMSTTAYAMGDLEQAGATADEAVSTFKQVRDTGPEFAGLFAIALSAQAYAMVARQHLGEAVSAAQKALELLARPGISNRMGEASLLTASAHVILATARLQLGLPDEALVSARAARSALHQHVPSPVGKAQLLLAESYRWEGLALAGLDRPDDALAPLQTAAELLEVLGSDYPPVTVPLASALSVLGICHQQLGNTDLAVQTADRSIALLDKPGQLHPSARTVLAQSLLVHARGWGERGDDAEAYHGFERILELYGNDPPDDPGGVLALGTALAITSRYLWVQGDMGTAIERLTKADAVFRSVQPHAGAAIPITAAHAEALASLADCQAALGDVAGAAQSAAQALDLLRGCQPHTQPQLTFMHGWLAKFLAQCLMHLDQSPAETIDEAIDAFRSLTIPEAAIELVQALNLRASHQNSLGDTASAAESAAEAVSLCRTITNQPGALPLIASTLRLLGWFLIRLRRPAEALAPFQESASRFRDLTGTPECPVIEHAEVELGLGLCLTALGRSPEANDHLQTALDLLRSLAASDPLQSPALAQAIMVLSEQLITYKQELDIHDNMPALAQILDLNATILARSGEQAAAESIEEYARRWQDDR